MARANPTSAHLETSTIPSVVYPFTMACWVRPITATGSTFLGIGSTTSSSQYVILSRSSGNATFEAPLGTAATGASIAVINQWYHICGRANSSSNWEIFTDGVIGSSGVPAYTPSGLNRLTLTGVYLTTFGSQANADIAEAAFWAGVALTNVEILELSKKGTPASSIRPQNLTHYWPLYGGHEPELDVIGGNHLTMVNGTPPNVSHPWEYYTPNNNPIPYDDHGPNDAFGPNPFVTDLVPVTLAEGSINPLTIAVSQGLATSIVNQVGIVRLSSSITGISLAKQVGPTHVATTAPNIILTKQINLSRSASQASSALLTKRAGISKSVLVNNTISLLKQAGKPISVASVATPQLSKRANLSRGATSTVLTTATKQANKSFSISVVTSATILAQRIVLKTISALLTTVASLTKRPQIVRSASIGGQFLLLNRLKSIAVRVWFQTSHDQYLRIRRSLVLRIVLRM